MLLSSVLCFLCTMNVAISDATEDSSHGALCALGMLLSTIGSFL